MTSVLVFLDRSLAWRAMFCRTVVTVIEIEAPDPTAARDV